MKKKKINNIAFLLLFLLTIVIPFPDYSLISKAIIALALWNFIFFFKQYPLLIEKHKEFLFALMTPGILAVAGLFWSDNVNQGLQEVQRLLPFFFIPLAILPLKINREKYKWIFNWFSAAVFSAFTIGLIFHWLFKFFNWGVYDSYHEFAFFLNRHPTYFSLFTVIIMIHAIYFLLKEYRFYYVLHIATGLFILYTLSTRIAFPALIIGVIIIFFVINNFLVKYRFLLILPILIVAIISSIWVFQKKNPFERLHHSNMSYMEHRVKHWESVWEISLKTPLAGKGTGSSRSDLWNLYKEKGLKNAFQEKYNAHNQFLEVILNYGFSGFFLFLLSVLFLFKSFAKCNDKALAWSILTVLLVFMLTESILVRLSGIVIYALWISLLFKICKDER